MHKACIELHFGPKLLNDVICTRHDMHPFCECGYAVRVPQPHRENNVSCICFRCLRNKWIV